VTALVVAALAEEVARVDGIEVLVTGVGKAVAAATLAHRLATGPRPDVVVNIGTAGAVAPGMSGLHEVTFVTQHDLPYDALEVLVGPLHRGYLLTTGSAPAPTRGAPQGAVTLATADIFVADPQRAARIASAGVHLVDMEAFAYAATCAVFGVPMRCVKAVSDAADEEASDSWLDTVEKCAATLAQWLQRHINAP
jgi:adenosylhomocysteine nucleosidase